MSLAERLWRENQDLAQECLRHPFVQGIASGKLERSKFAFYVGQDAYFLEAFARAYALAMAKSPDREGFGAWKELLDGVLRELELHAEYARTWGIDLTPQPAPATSAYTDFLLRVAALEPVGPIAAAMTPCMRLYAYLGRSLEPITHPGSPYLEWVRTYASPEFEALAKRLEELLDRYAGEPSRLSDLYRRAMQLEHAFFEAAWRSG
ncbi:MAG: TenA family protein [Armatimonadetes bacterium]|nr:TenA family protein [Armatimonadota bacterium]MDW8153431.1 TenA family protein [Armatimonadota bacterium]